MFQDLELITPSPMNIVEIKREFLDNHRVLLTKEV